MRHSAVRCLQGTALVAMAALMVAAAGCSKKIPSGPFGAYLVAYPEGVRDSLQNSPSDLVVWPDVPLLVTEIRTDKADKLTYFYVSRSGLTESKGEFDIPPSPLPPPPPPPPSFFSGFAFGEIMDYVQASGYQMFRDEDGGGYRSFNDFPLSPERRFTDRSYYGTPSGAVVMPPAQFFVFSDATPAHIPARSYVGRAEVSRVTGSAYPLTNRGTTPDTTAIPDMQYTGLVGLPGDPDTGPAPPDSLLALSWSTVPGAAGYWVHIYQKRTDAHTSGDAEEIAQPAPIATGKVRDKFIGFFPAPRTAYKLGDPVPPGARILVYRVLLGLQEVLIRVSAVDASGRLIAMISTSGDDDVTSERVGQVDIRRTFLAGAKRVTPARPVPPPGPQ